MKRAIISDIHGNFEALTAVLKQIEELNVDQIICLGDIIGYGPNPIECLDLVMSRCAFTILGNHDQAAIFDPDGFNPVASKAIYWTRDQLEKDTSNLEQADLRWDFLGELPRRHDEGKFLFVHGSPRDPTNEYVFPETVYERDRLDHLMGRFEQYCFQGHTHIPGVFYTNGTFLTPEDRDHHFELSEEKVMVNVGSVGQPRDGNPQPCFCVVDDEEGTLIYNRVDYDPSVTRDKIYAVAELDNMLGDRLMTGR